MKINRRDLLLGTGAAALVGPTLSRAASGKPEHLIYVIVDGGWDVTFCHDPKFHVPDIEGPEVDANPENPDDVDTVVTYGDDMDVVVNGFSRPRVGDFFDRWADRTAIVNGLWMGSIAHQACRVRLITGTGDSTRPDVVSIAGHRLGADLPLGSVDFSGLGVSGHLAASTGRIGRNSQLKALIDPQSRFAAPDGADWTLPLMEPSDDEHARVQAHITRRAERFRERYGLGEHNQQAVDGLLESMARRERLLREAGPIVDGLELGVLPTLRAQAELTALMFSNKLCQSVTLQNYANWDSHYFNPVQHGLFDSFFASLDVLLETLDASGLLDTTLIVVASEMTRTPKRNATGGKDHWAHSSAMLIGAGVHGGRTFGATDDNLESMPMELSTGEVHDGGQLMKYDNFAAGVLTAMDVDPGDWLPGVTPFTGAFDL